MGLVVIVGCVPRLLNWHNAAFLKASKKVPDKRLRLKMQARGGLIS
jgi:hypothetical protein